MSKNSAVISAIFNTLANSNPPIDIDVLNDGKKIDISNLSNADVDEMHRAILRLEALQETKNIMYKQVIDRYGDQKRSFNDEINATLFYVKKAVEDFAAMHKDAKSEHFDLPSGRVQFGHSSPLEITVDADVLDKKLRELGKSADPDLKACVKVELTPVKNAIKSAIEKKKIEGGWARIARVEHVSFKDNSSNQVISETAAPQVASRAATQVPVGGRVAPSVAAENDSYDDSDNDEDGVTSDPADISPPIQTPAPASVATIAQTPAPAPAPAPAPIATHAPIATAPQPATATIATPAGIDFTKRPRIFEVPKLEHFTDESLETNRNSFEFMEIAKLLENQTKVKPDQLTAMPIERIRDGMQKTTAELGFKRDDVRTWVAYHTGVMPADVAPAKFSDIEWRKLTALAIHAVAVRAKHLASAAPNTGAGSSVSPADVGAPSTQG